MIGWTGSWFPASRLRGERPRRGSRTDAKITVISPDRGRPVAFGRRRWPLSVVNGYRQVPNRPHWCPVSTNGGFLFNDLLTEHTCRAPGVYQTPIDIATVRQWSSTDTSHGRQWTPHRSPGATNGPRRKSSRITRMTSNTGCQWIQPTGNIH